jgi:hypothetical protein
MFQAYHAPAQVQTPPEKFGCTLVSGLLSVTHDKFCGWQCKPSLLHRCGRKDDQMAGKRILFLYPGVFVAKIARMAHSSIG